MKQNVIHNLLVVVGKTNSCKRTVFDRLARKRINFINPENDKHPLEISEFMQKLSLQMRTDSLSEIVILTNSLYVVDFAPYENVFCCNERGGFKLLSQHPQALDREDYFTSGEFWSAVGEDWDN